MHLVVWMRTSRSIGGGGVNRALGGECEDIHQVKMWSDGNHVPSLPPGLSTPRFLVHTAMKVP